MKDRVLSFVCLILGIILILSGILLIAFSKEEKQVMGKKEVEEQLLSMVKKYHPEDRYVDKEEERTLKVTLSALKYKYHEDIEKFEKEYRCNLDYTYVSIKQTSSSNEYSPYLFCLGLKEK